VKRIAPIGARCSGILVCAWSAIVEPPALPARRLIPESLTAGRVPDFHAFEDNNGRSESYQQEGRYFQLAHDDSPDPKLEREAEELILPPPTQSD